MKKIQLSLIVLFGILLLALNSCEKEENPATNDPNPSEHKFEVGSATAVDVFGQVVDENGNAISGAAVSLGASSTITDANGTFFLENASAHENLAYVKVEKTGYFLGSRSFVPTNGVNRVQIMLLTKQNIGSFDANSGGTVSGDGIVIEFQAGVVDANGDTYAGMVQVAAQYIDPESEDFFDYMPGNLIGANASGGQYLESKGMIAVELSDGVGNALQLAEGSEATVSFPLSAGLLADAPSTIDLWHFDEELGYWILEGQATLQGSAYVASVSHFSFWNCDIPTAYVIIDGQILEGGVGVPNLTIRIVSTGFGTGSAITDANGGFGGIVPANENLDLEVWFDCGGSMALLYTQNLGSLSNNTTLPSISITTTGSAINVSGNVVDCAYNPVSNGYIVYQGGQVAYLSGGNFDVLACSGSSLSIQGFDIDNLTESGVSTYNLGASSLNVGQIVACNSLTEYIQWTVNGTDYLASSNFSFFDQGLFAGLSGNLPNYFYANFNNFTGVGSYVCDNTFANSISAEGIGSISSGSLNLAITQYGTNPGDLIEGTISGTAMVVDSMGTPAPPVSITVTGSIHFFRN